MSELLIFGSPEPNVFYKERRAVYVVISRHGDVAVVKSGQKHFLPGGGALPHETSEETVVREVQEELARSVRLLRGLGEVIQYFYSTDDNQHYKMLAVFFAGEFTDDGSGGSGEDQLFWLPVTAPGKSYFHECHAWAVRQA